MKRNWLAAILMIIGVVYFKSAFDRSEKAPPDIAPQAGQPTQQTAEAPSPPLPQVARRQTGPGPTVAPPIAPERDAEASPARPPKGSIPFEIKNGLVIAFGDVLLGKPSHDSFPETGFIEAPKLHPWTGREVAYSVHPDLPNPERVQRAIEYFNANTPVRFVPLSNHTDSIVFSPSEIPLCLSYVGKIGGHQPIFLDDRCNDQEILHEIMHALGFIHEQSRPDRDRYVRVHWDRIEPDKQGQFSMATPTMIGPHLGRPFDYNSIMLYESTAFAKARGEVTLESNTEQAIAPSNMGLSEEDLTRLNLMFAN